MIMWNAESYDVTGHTHTTYERLGLFASFATFYFHSEINYIDLYSILF